MILFINISSLLFKKKIIYSTYIILYNIYIFKFQIKKWKKKFSLIIQF